MRTKTCDEMTNKGHIMNSELRMNLHRDLRMSHTAITDAARPVVAKHLALAFFKEGDDFASHVSCAIDVRPEYIAHHIGKIPRTEDAFNNWEGKPHLCDAIILDTMMNVQEEMLGADDSRADYMPDGLRQVQLLTEDSYDINGFLWYCLNRLYATVPPFNEEDAETAEAVDEHLEAVYDLYMQDCSSAIMYELSAAFNA